MKLKTLIIFLLKFILTGIILSFIFNHFNIRALHWQKISTEAIIICSLLWFANIGLQLYRWYFLLQLIDPGIKIRTCVISLFGSFTLGLFTPGRLGELGRALFIPSISWKKISFLALAERFFTILALAICALIGIALWPEKPALQLPSGYLLPRAGTIFILCFLLILLFRIKKHWQYKIKKLLSKSRFLFSWRSITVLFSASLSFVAIFIAQTAVLLFSMANISFSTANAVAAIIHFSKSVLPLTIGDLGVREGIAASLMQQVADNAEAGMLAALFIFALNVLLPAILGIPCIFKIHLQRR